MSVRLEGHMISLEGQCRVEDAEPLLGWLQADRGRAVDLTDAEHLHTAVLQILMALRPHIRGAGKNSFIKDWIIPSLITTSPSAGGPADG
jgi:ABC-type transporter Mla MlaB component